MADGERRLRADAERSVRSILEAAERILSNDPSATMEQIAEAAGVARTTIHRRFANRDALVRSMADAAWHQIREAVQQARPGTAPPLVALHQATANILRIKSGWPFALGQPAVEASTAQVQAEVFAACDQVLVRAQLAGIISADADLIWARRVYIALIGETAHVTSSTGDGDPDALAARVIDTLLYGVSRPFRENDRPMR
jgi:AcrR family transcriptional regulator